MKVTATARGYFGKLREPGDTFDVPSGSKGNWFVPVKAARAAEPQGDKQGDKQGDGTQAKSEDLA